MTFFIIVIAKFEYISENIFWKVRNRENDESLDDVIKCTMYLEHEYTWQ